jgi:hypothetical protein
MYPTREKSKLNRDGPDEKAVGTASRLLLRGLKLRKLFSGF